MVFKPLQAAVACIETVNEGVIQLLEVVWEGTIPTLHVVEVLTLEEPIPDALLLFRSKEQASEYFNSFLGG
jgi:hypothetical protein